MTKDGKVLRAVTNAVPILAQDGSLIGYRGADRDVTEQKLAEERIANVQRLESVGRPGWRRCSRLQQPAHCHQRI